MSCSDKDPSPYYRSPHLKKTFVCLKEDTDCWKFPACRSFCEDLFFYEEKIQMCYNWPISVFKDFENLKDAIDKMAFQYIEPEVMDCFLEFVEEDRDILFREFGEEEAKAFLKELAYNKTLAFYLSGKDKGDFLILSTLFLKIGGTVSGAIAKPIFEEENFLILLHEQGNRSAWTWLDDYLIHYCRRDESCKEPLDYYCRILRDVGFRALKDFFTNHDFERGYERSIESKDCQSRKCRYGNSHEFAEMCDNI